MKTKHFSWTLFEKAPIVGIVRNLTLEKLKHILPLYREAGLTTIEITMNTPDAETLIRYAIENEQEGLNIGAGTVCDKHDLKRALIAGAQFIVTPITDKKVIKACVKLGMPIFSGAFTPTEIYQADAYGASMVKIFPATTLGPNYIKDIKAPMNHLKLLPTGGVSLENIPHFIKAGATGFGIGGQLFDKKLIANKDWQGLKTHFLTFANLVSVK
jgi:2-dehydro-3-deoxyphosphogluconate aldolase / (4S)-4-hydroxy-2-oxoglutarate aldolase